MSMVLNLLIEQMWQTNIITVNEDGQSFVVQLGDITESDQYRIEYKVQPIIHQQTEKIK